MKGILEAALGVAFAIGVATAALADTPPTANGVVINEAGTFTDKGVWLYKTAAGLYRYGPATLGTNETLVMPSPSPEAGGAVAGIEILRHPFDTLGYPLHISLVEKLFASSLQVPVMATGGDVIWSYEYGAPITDEKPYGKDAQRPPLKVWGPFHGDAIPLSQVANTDYAKAFDFAKGALEAITNMPESQKNLANYGVLFIDDGSTVWVEFGPRFGPNEAPHLGCQTQLGRDMVFGFIKKQTSQTTAGKFLQCF